MLSKYLTFGLGCTGISPWAQASRLSLLRGPSPGRAVLSSHLSPMPAPLASALRKGASNCLGSRRGQAVCFQKT